MAYIPIFLDVTGRECVVVGGGEVAARKVESLLEAGARVTVVSPRLSPPLESLVAKRVGDAPRARLPARRYPWMRAGVCGHRRSEIASRSGGRGARAGNSGKRRRCTGAVHVYRAGGFAARGAADRNFHRRRLARIRRAAPSRSRGSVRPRVRAHARSAARRAPAIACRRNRSRRADAAAERPRQLRAARTRLRPATWPRSIGYSLLTLAMV